MLWTDLFQFVLKMAIVIGGGVLRRARRRRHGHDAWQDSARCAREWRLRIRWRFCPIFREGLTSEALWTLPVITFLVYLGVQWWAFWYPGAEPGGGGYIAQRIFSARDERQGLLSVLVVQHRALRAAALAVDSDGARRDRALSGLEASGDQLHDDRATITCRMRCAEFFSRDFWPRSCPRSRRS